MATTPAPMSITRLADCSLLKVSGVVDRSMAESFGQALRQTVGFSSMPVVVDLRDVEFLHSRAISRLMKVWKSANDAGVFVQVVVDARSAQFLKA
jgi:anti-anti-sigma regulatory factor